MSEQETPAERRRRKNRERKQKQRERREKMDMRELRLDLSATEREMITSTAKGRGFEDITEYISYLVRADSELMAINPKVNPAAECVTRHMKAFCAKCDTPEIPGKEKDTA